MSEENVETVRRAVEAYEREGLNGWMRYYAPEIEWTTTDKSIERATYRGHDGVRRFFGSFDDEFDDLRFDVEELIDAGEQVVLTLRVGGRGKASGAPVEMTRSSSARCATAWSTASATTRRRRRPSKPPGCGSRRCRRRTSRLSSDNSRE